MSLARALVLIFGPLPIVAASMGISTWLKSERSLPPAANEVLELPSLTSSAMATEPARPTTRPRRATDTSLDDRCQETARRLKEKLGDDGRVIVRSPFVIAGDMTDDDLDEWHRKTIQPATEAMANTYFDKPPSQPITILLYPGETSYNAGAKKLFGDKGTSVYGYYKPQNRTLVMNIGTGKGTLVHELTHALVDFDFPDVPDWFNEGLASLHEQCRFRDGDDGPWVEGMENWRLTGLQKSIRAKRLRPLKTMIEANDFRGELEGTNYAQARYLCLYMQREMDVLAKFYERFRDAHKQDTLGIKTLEEVLEIDSWSKLDRDFQKWVLTLER